MAWALLDDNFATNPKVMEAVQRHALARDLYVCGLCYCRKFLTSGVIPRTALKSIGFIGNERKAAEALVSVGLWAQIDGGYQIHDYALQYDDEADKARKDDKSAKRREAGRKGGLTRAANAQANTQANVEANFKQTDKQPPSNSQPHRNGVVRTGLVLSSGSSENNELPRFDEWLVRLQEAYPEQRVTHSHLTEKAFVDAINSHREGPHVAWSLMQANLENQKRGYQWRIKRMIPKLENWLRNGEWLQRHDEHPPSALVSEKTARTLSSAAEFIKAGGE